MSWQAEIDWENDGAAYAAEVVEEFIAKPPRTLRTLQMLVLAGCKPYSMVVVGGRQMELISMPFIQDGVSIRGGGMGIGVMIREKDDPTTMREWSIPARDVRNAIRLVRRSNPAKGSVWDSEERWR